MPNMPDSQGGGRYDNPSTPDTGGSGNGSPAGTGNTAPKRFSGTNFQYIYEFFKNKGLSDAAIAGIMGNIQIESSFSPNAYNANEGAVGIAQWEGGRRYALQHFASSKGTSEFDLETQLEFYWHELSTNFSGVLSRLRQTHDARSAAYLIDSDYEISSGSTHDARANAAAGILGSGFKDPGASGHYAGTIAAGSGGPDVGGSTGSNYDGAIGGFSLRVLNAIPALRGILNEARAGNWSTERFINTVENSAWYRQHSDTARQAIASQLSDPATWQKNIDQVVFQINEMAGQLGMPLSHAEAEGIATNALMSGMDNNQQWLQYQIAHRQDYSHLNSTDNLTGQMAQTVNQLRQTAADYGITPQDSWLARHAQNILSGQTTIDTYTQMYRDMAKSAFPALAEQIDRGITVADAAQPYIQSMSNLLEVDPSSLSAFTPQIRRALQGTNDPNGKSSLPQLTPVWQFENQVRQDPRWQYTDNAHQAMANTLTQVGQDWGFAA